MSCTLLEALINAPTVSNTGLLLVAGNSYDLFCFNSETGERIWTDSFSRSSYMVEPHVTEIDGNATVVYAIEALNGNIRQHGAWDGTRNWEFNCEDLSGVIGCQDGVEAEFSLSSTGNVLYYGDIFGKIIALKVADFVTPDPSSVPTTTISPNPTSVPTTAISPNPTTVPITMSVPTSTSAPTTTPSFVPSSMVSKSPSQIPSESEIASDTPSGEGSLAPVEIVMPVKHSKPSYSPSESPIMNTGNPSSPPSDSPTSIAGVINSASKQNTESSGGKRGGMILISVIAVAASLITGFLGLFAMQRRKSKRNARSFIHNDSSELAVEVCIEKVVPPDQGTVEEFCQTSDALALAEAVQRSPSRSTKKRSSKSPRKSPGPTTPSTLASITETDNEDVISHFDSAIDAMSPNSLLEDKGANNSDSTGKETEIGRVASQDENGFLNTARSFFSMKQVDSAKDEDTSLRFLPTSLSVLFDGAASSPTALPPIPPEDDDASDDASNQSGNSSSNHSGSSQSGSSDNSIRIDFIGPSDSDESQDHDEGDDVFDKLESYLPSFGILFGRPITGLRTDEDDEKKPDMLSDTTHAIHTKSSHDDWSIDSASIYLDDERSPSSVPEGECLPLALTPQNKVEESGIWRNIITTLSKTEKRLGLAPDSPPKPVRQNFTDNPDVPFDKDDAISCPDDEHS